MTCKVQIRESEPIQIISPSKALPYRFIWYITNGGHGSILKRKSGTETWGFFSMSGILGVESAGRPSAFNHPAYSAATREASLYKALRAGRDIYCADTWEDLYENWMMEARKAWKLGWKVGD